jgi:hypothetical protein
MTHFSRIGYCLVDDGSVPSRYFSPPTLHCIDRNVDSYIIHYIHFTRLYDVLLRADFSLSEILHMVGILYFVTTLQCSAYTIHQYVLYTVYRYSALGISVGRIVGSYI